MKNKKIENNKVTAVFDEEKIIKDVFSFKSHLRNNLYKFLFVNKNPYTILSYAIKYLLHIKNENPVKIEKIIRKWCVVVCYYYAVTKYGYKERSIELDTLLAKDFTFKSLDECIVTSSEVIGNVFNDTPEINSNYNKNINVWCESLTSAIVDDDDHNICIKKVNNLLTNDNYFFTNHNGRPESFSRTFGIYKNKKSFDRLISELINSPHPVSFEIEFEGDEFKECIKNFKRKKELPDGKTSALEKKTIPVMFGFIATQIIDSENLNTFEKFEHIKYDLLCFHLGQGKCDIDTSGFIPQKEDGINYDEIVPFEFKLNQVKYSFSKNGLRIV